MSSKITLLATSETKMIYFLASYLSYLRVTLPLFFSAENYQQTKKNLKLFLYHTTLYFALYQISKKKCNISKYQILWNMVRLEKRRRRFWYRFVSLTYISGHSAEEEVCSQRSRTDHVTFLGRCNQTALQKN